MANEINNKLDRLDGKKKRTCDDGCKYFMFPDLPIACVLSDVYSVRQGEDCSLYEEDK